MPTDHIVTQGDCIDSIAAANGFFPDTLWEHADNAELRKQRQDPNVLNPGDKVVIPDLQVKEEDAAAEQRHRFRRKGVPAMLRLVLRDPKEPEPPEDEPEAGDAEDDESSFEDEEENVAELETEPVANTPFVLTIDGEQIEGETDADGKIEIPLPPQASSGRLVISPGTEKERVIPLDLGGMDPVDTVLGARKRLNNLGYRCVPDGEEPSDDFAHALMSLQHDNKLDESGELDSATQDKLKELHGC